MVPLAPARFSTTTDVPSASPRRGARSLAPISAAPAGGYPTTSEIGRSNFGAAIAACPTAVIATSPATSKHLRIKLVVYPKFFLISHPPIFFRFLLVLIGSYHFNLHRPGPCASAVP